MGQTEQDILDFRQRHWYTLTVAYIHHDHVSAKVIWHSWCLQLQIQVDSDVDVKISSSLMLIILLGHLRRTPTRGQADP
jgi:hypothetical protein